MTTNSLKIQTRGIEVQVVRKDIKHLYIRVYPPQGCVRVSVPLHVTDEDVRMAVIARLEWIKRQQARIVSQPMRTRRDMRSGEHHYVFGRQYLLEVVERRGLHQVSLKNNSTLLLTVNPGTSSANRERVLNEWYRALLKERIPILLEKWQSITGKDVAEWGVKRMKTRWGSCNINRRRIWLNLELAKKPVTCLEYVLVHEMVHLFERYHNDNFNHHMDQFMPQWRMHRDTLNQSP